MLAATITAALIYVLVQRSGALALGTACWDERLSRAGRNNSCVASQPFLIFGHGKAIHRMDLDGKNQRRLLAGVGSPILLDFHFREERIYWADKHSGVIYKAPAGGAHRQKLSSDKHISGLAVDWIWNRVYWTSEEKGKIKTMDINGKNERTLLRHLTQPSNINVDPTKRFVFWLSGGMTPSIQRCDVTGQMKTTIIKIAEKLEALSIDREDKRLFWVQFGLQGESAIASCDYDGNVLHIINQPLRSQSMGISVFLEHLYYTDAATRLVKQVNKYTGRGLLKIKHTAKPPGAVKVVHPLNQPMTDSQSSFPGCDEQSGNCMNVCSSLAEKGTCQCSEGFALNKQGTHCEDLNECAHWNHGCSLGCENIPGSYFCTCPKGYALLPDRKTCGEIIPCNGNITCGHGCLTTDEGVVCVCPEGSSLQEDGQACTGCLSADRGGCSQLCTPVTPARWECGCLPGYQLHQDGKRCIATGPPPYLLVANLVDVRQIDPDGTRDQTVVEEPRGAIIAVDYDPVQENVYFASTSQKTIESVNLNSGSRDILVSDGLDSPEGLAIDWIHRRMYWTDTSQSTIDCSTLVGLNRETIVSKGLEKPRGIAVHPLAKKLFWTDIGAVPVVESVSLKGKHRAVIASTNLVSPSGLTIDFTEDRLFWCDQRTGLVETAALDGSDRQILVENQVGRPFDLAVFEDRLWISDREHQQLRSVHKRTGRKLQRIHGNMVQPGSIVVVHPLAKPGADVCLHLNGGCAQVCKSKLGLAHCSCLSRYIRSADGKSCLPADASNGTAESGDSESTDLTSLKNKTFNDESTPLTPELTAEKVEDDLDSKDDPTRFTDKMVSDQHECYSLRCDVNAQCLPSAGSPTCLCLEGFTGDGQFCADIDECKQETYTCDNNAECQNAMGNYLCKCQAGYYGNGKTCQELETTTPWPMTGSPADVTTRHHNSNSVESCPSSHESYCLYQGVCVYFPEMESYACNCASGYMGERCQFSDLEWWELQQAEEEKRRNVVIAACMVLLVSLLSIVACITYCYGTTKLFHKPQPSVDNVSETSVTDETMSETTTSSMPRFYMVAENGMVGKIIPVMGCPRRAVCPSCSSETGDNPVSEGSGTLSQHNRGYECSMVSAVAVETMHPTVHHSSPSLSSSYRVVQG